MYKLFKCNIEGSLNKYRLQNNTLKTKQSIINLYFFWNSTLQKFSVLNEVKSTTLYPQIIGSDSSHTIVKDVFSWITVYECGLFLPQSLLLVVIYSKKCKISSFKVCQLIRYLEIMLMLRTY